MAIAVWLERPERNIDVCIDKRQNRSLTVKFAVDDEHGEASRDGMETVPEVALDNLASIVWRLDSAPAKHVLATELTARDWFTVSLAKAKSESGTRCETRKYTNCGLAQVCSGSHKTVHAA
jgi:hypothetical protein